MRSTASARENVHLPVPAAVKVSLAVACAGTGLQRDAAVALVPRHLCNCSSDELVSEPVIVCTNDRMRDAGRAGNETCCATPRGIVLHA